MLRMGFIYGQNKTFEGICWNWVPNILTWPRIWDLYKCYSRLLYTTIYCKNSRQVQCCYFHLSQTWHHKQSVQQYGDANLLHPPSDPCALACVRTTSASPQSSASPQVSAPPLFICETDRWSHCWSMLVIAGRCYLFSWCSQLAPLCWLRLGRGRANAAFVRPLHTVSIWIDIQKWSDIKMCFPVVC